MGPIWGRQDPGGPHVGPMNFAIWARTCKHAGKSISCEKCYRLVLQIVYTDFNLWSDRKVLNSCQMLRLIPNASFVVNTRITVSMLHTLVHHTDHLNHPHLETGTPSYPCWEILPFKTRGLILFVYADRKYASFLKIMWRNIWVFWCFWEVGTRDIYPTRSLQVLRTGASNHIPQYLWDVITRYQLPAHNSPYTVLIIIRWHWSFIFVSLKLIYFRGFIHQWPWAAPHSILAQYRAIWRERNP